MQSFVQRMHQMHAHIRLLHMIGSSFPFEEGDSQPAVCADGAVPPAVQPPARTFIARPTPFQ